MSKQYDTGKHKWTHGTVVEWVYGRTPSRWLLGPCPRCGMVTSNYGGKYSCHDDYCPNSASQFACPPEPTPDWWNTNINVQLDWNMWCAFLDGFVNLQESEAAFGDTPRDAVAALRKLDQSASTAIQKEAK